MNMAQRIIGIIVVIIILAMLIFPPSFVLSGEGMKISCGYNFILTPPERGFYGNYCNMDLITLCVQWFGVLVAGGIAFLIADRGRKG